MARRGQLGLEIRVAPSAFIFGTIANELRGPNDVTRRFSKLVKKAQQSALGGQLTGVTLQCFRHGHATPHLGHSYIQMTMGIYSHVLATIRREALSVLMSEWAAAR